MNALLFALVTTLAPVAAPDDRADQIDRIVKEQMAATRVPGVSVAVVKEGQVAFAKGYGFANLEHQVPAKPETVYQIGSLTKQFTATLIMMLRDEGKLALDDPVSKYVEGVPESWNEVTIRHLLTHTSGIKSYTDISGLFTARNRLDVTPWEVVKTVLDEPMASKPGERWAYNNTGYVLLGMVAEKALGRTFAAVLDERILRPLDMGSTMMNDWGRVVPHRATGYDVSPDRVRNAGFISMSWPYAAGAMASSVLDLAKWDAALYSDRLLKRETLREMWTPAKLNGGGEARYGYGWGLRREAGRLVVSHGGGIPGFTSMIARYPDDKITVIVLSNAMGGAAGNIASQVAALYIPDLAKNDPDAMRSEPEARKRLEQFLDSVREGKPDRSLLTDEFSKFLTDDLVSQTRGQFLAMGSILGFDLVQARMEDGLPRFQYKVRFEKGSLEVRLTVARDGRFAGIGLAPG